MSNLGAFFLAATIISLLVSTFQTKLFRKNFAADLLCMAAIILILGIDTFFALGLNYKAPYTGVIKYDYQTLPFFCLLAGSLLVKWQSLFTTLTMKLNRSWLFFGIASAGAVCLTVALFTNFFNSIAYSHLNYLVFTAEGVVGTLFSILHKS